MNQKEQYNEIVEEINTLLDLYNDGIRNDRYEEENMIRLSHEIVTLYGVLNLLKG